MSNTSYPDIIKSLPKAAVPIPGVEAWLGQGTDFQIVFFEIPAGAVVPPHSHAAQFGILIEGEMSLTINGETNRLTKGDTYYIPAGAVHQATCHTLVRAMDFFAEPARYKTV